MFVDLNYNPNDKVWNFPGVEKYITEIEKTDGQEIAEYYRNLTWDNILKKLSTGVYEFYDVNDPHFDNITFKTHEYVTPELAVELHFDFIDWCLQKGDTEIYMSHPYGVCDNWEQIFKKIPEIKYYQNSKEKFVIFLCCHTKKNQPKSGGWRWHKWGPYIGNQESQCEYLADEPNIELVYSFHVSRIIEK